MSEIREQVDDAITIEGGADLDAAKRVLRNPKFLALFGSQIFLGTAVVPSLPIGPFTFTGTTAEL